MTVPAQGIAAVNGRLANSSRCAGAFRTGLHIPMSTLINVDVLSYSVVDQKPCGAVTSDSMWGPGYAVFIGYAQLSSMRASFLRSDTEGAGTVRGFSEYP